MDEDLRYFGEMNSKPVMTLMEDATKEWGELKTPFYAMTFVNKTIIYLGEDGCIFVQSFWVM